MGVLGAAGVESGTEVAPVQSRAQLKEAARLLPGVYLIRPHQRVGAARRSGPGRPFGRRGGWLVLGGSQGIRMPAIVAVSQEAIAPPNIALSPTLARSDLRPGATAAMPPIWMPIEEKLANPQSA